jgi:aminobenzoyl-glutamate utilization protein B
VQINEAKYVPLMNPSDQPAVELNREKMEKFRPELRKYYYNPGMYMNYELFAVLVGR